MPEEPSDAIPPTPMYVDAQRLKALANPLRIQLYELLADRGPSTASQLGAALGESSGTTSYHLRQLAAAGFIEDDPERGDRRDRWWRVRPGGFTLEASSVSGDEAASAAMRLAATQLWQGSARQLQRWYESADAWGQPWQDVSGSLTFRFEASAEELGALRDDLIAVLQQHRARLVDRTPPSDSVRAVAQVHVFPIGDAPTSGAA